MKTLILMRHADSDYPIPGQRDRDRTLNGRGRTAATLMGDWLRRADTVPTGALISSAERTRETWSLMACPIEATFDDVLYLAEPEDYLKAIQNAPDCSCLLVLGHNPGMESAMGRMADGKQISAPPAATAIYTLPIKTWRDAAFGTATLQAFETPNSLG